MVVSASTRQLRNKLREFPRLSGIQIQDSLNRKLEMLKAISCCIDCETMKLLFSMRVILWFCGWSSAHIHQILTFVRVKAIHLQGLILRRKYYIVNTRTHAHSHRSNIVICIRQMCAAKKICFIVLDRMMSQLNRPQPGSCRFERFRFEQRSNHKIFISTFHLVLYQSAPLFCLLVPQLVLLSF